jgi:hypothetical protein
MSSNDRLTRAIALSRARKPSDEAVARMRSSLVLAASSASAAPAVKTMKIMSFKAWLAGGFIAGVAFVSAGVVLHRSTSRESHVVPPAVTATAIAAPTLTPTASMIEAVAVDDLPRADEPVRVANRAPAAAADKETEVALITAAENAMPSDPATALSLAERHAAKFPSGQLVEEREVLAIEALAALGRADDATARAESFLGRNPHTPYRARVARALAHHK